MSVSNCVSECFKYGNHLAGISQLSLCECGTEVLDEVQQVPCDHVTFAECPANPREKCAVHHVAVYETGFNAFADVNQSTVIFTKLPADPPLARIVFYFQFNGRNVRQMLRLLRVLYDRSHFYYIHVDLKSSYAYSILRTHTFIRNAKNIHLTTRRKNVVWTGSNSKLDAFLTALNEIWELWGETLDYVVNYSESCFPVAPVSEFTNLLTHNMGRNFLAANKRSKAFTSATISQHAHDCDNHMYFVAKRKSQEIRGLFIASSSDWVVMHRDLVHYIAVERDELVQKLTATMVYVSTSPELFVATVLPCSSHDDCLSMGMVCSSYNLCVPPEQMQKRILSPFDAMLETHRVEMNPVYGY